MTTTRHATNDGVRIAYETRTELAAADASWVVLVHGLGYARWGWGPLLDRLETHHRLVLLDNRGIGASDVPPGPYDATTMAGDVVAVLDELGLDRVHVVGTSLGGMISQELAAAHPDLVDRLVLLASTAGGERAHPMPQVTRELIAAMPTMAPEDALRRAVANALASPDTDRGRAIVNEVVRHRLATPQDPAGWQAQAAAGTTYDGGDRVAGISVPTLVVHGADDRVVATGNADVLGGLLPDAEVHVVADAGHLLFWERPDVVAGLVLDFLGRAA